MPTTTDILARPVVREALDVSMYMFIIMSHTDLEFLPLEHGATYFCYHLGEFTLTVEDVSVMFCLSVFAYEGATNLVSSVKEKRRCIC